MPVPQSRKNRRFGYESLEPRRAPAVNLVADINPGLEDARPAELTTLGNRLFFAATDAVHGRELWQLERQAVGGAQQPQMVADLAEGVASSKPQLLTALGDRLYFIADDGVSGEQLWTSDGTAQGTHRITDWELGPRERVLDARAHDNLLFLVMERMDADGQQRRQQLWVTNGTAVGTRTVGSWDDQRVEMLTTVGDVLYFRIAGLDLPRLWRADGRESGTYELSEFTTPAKTYFVVDNNELLYIVRDAVWATDGLTGGTRVLSRHSGLVPINSLRVEGGRVDVGNCGAQCTYQRVRGPEGDDLPIHPLVRRPPSDSRDRVSIRTSHQGLTELWGIKDWLQHKDTYYVLGRSAVTFPDTPRVSGIWQTDLTIEGTQLLHEVAGQQDIGELVFFDDAIYVSMRADDQHGFELFRFTPQSRSESFGFTARRYTVGEDGRAIGQEIEVRRSNGSGARSFVVRIQLGAGLDEDNIITRHAPNDSSMVMRFEDGETTKRLYVSSVLDELTRQNGRRFFTPSVLVDPLALVTLRDDEIYQPIRDIHLRLWPLGSELRPTEIVSATVNVADNDAPQIRIMESDGATTLMAGGVIDTLDVSLNYAPEQPVIVKPQFDSELLNVTPHQLVFTPENWQIAQAFNLQGRKAAEYVPFAAYAEVDGPVIPSAARLGVTVHAADTWEGDSPGISVADIGSRREGLRPSEMTVIDQHLYFTATNRWGAKTQWRTDGTEAGTELVGSDVITADMIPHNGRWYRAWQNVSDFGVYAYYPRTGEEESIHYADDVWSADFAKHQDWLYFTNGRRLWASTGTKSDTRRLFDGFDIQDLTSSGEYLYFTSRGSLFRTNSSVDDVLQLFPVVASQMVDVAGTLYFLGKQHGHQILGVTDGSLAGTRLLPSTMPLGFQPRKLSAVGGTLYVQGVGQSGRPEVWRVAANKEQGAVRHTAEFVGVAERVDDFQGRPLLSGDSLWVANGSGLEPSLGPVGRIMTAPTVLDDVFFFAVATTEPLYEIWRSDGTAEGTEPIAELRVKTDRSWPDTEALDMVEFQGRYYFTAEDSVFGNELWSTDGTAEGTHMFFDYEGQGPSISQLVRTGDRLAFVADDGVAPNTQVWQADGDGVRMALAVPEEARQHSDSRWNRLLPIDDQAVFVFRTEEQLSRHSRQLETRYWRFDAAASTPEYLGAELGPRIDLFGRTPSATRHVQSGPNETLYFDGGRFDGQQIEPLELEGIGTSASQFTRVGDSLFFSAVDKDHGRELWVTRDEFETYQRLTDVVAGGRSSIARASLDYQRWASEFVAVDEQLYFTAEVGSYFFSLSELETTAHQLWRSDGTAAGTQLVLAPDDGHVFNLTAGEDQLFFATKNSNRLYVTNTVTGETELLREFQQLGDELLFHDGRLFLAADGGDGMELWSSDGTQGGTRQVADIVAGPNGSQPGDLTVLRDQLFFAAGDEATGRELWTSDGTAAGTELYLDLVTGADGSAPDELTAINDQLYFAADDQDGRRKLWRLDLAPPPGDADGDGRVDMSDFLILAAHFQQPSDDGPRQGDFDQNGQVDFRDFLILSQAFGTAAE